MKRKSSEVGEWVQISIFAVVILAALAWGVWYGIFYWTNCAFTPVVDAPALCFVNHNSGGSK